jgi:hypothetical protein
VKTKALLNVHEESMTDFPKPAKLYINIIVAAGMAVLIAGVCAWQSALGTYYAVYLALALVGSALKVRLPRATGTYSLSSLFIVVGLVRLGFSELVFAAAAATIAQCAWRARQRPSVVQVVFNVCSVVISAAAAYPLARVPARTLDGKPAMVALVLAAAVFFMVNTLLVSGVLTLTGSGPFRKIWEGWLLWALPYYVAGCLIAVAILLSDQIVGVGPPLASLPAAYLLFLYYRLHLQRNGAPV